MLKKFEGEKRKQYIALGVAGVLLGGGMLLLSYLFTGKEQKPQTPPPPKIETPPPQRIEEESFKKTYGEELTELKKRVEALEREKTSSPPAISSPPALPPAPPPPPQTQAPPPPPPPPSEQAQPKAQTPPPKPQVLTDLIGEVKKEAPVQQQQQQQSQQQQQQRKSSMRVPAGAFVRGILLSGLDAPTGGRAQTNPHPVLIRIVDKAVLPNLYKADVKDCFVIGSGYGDLASERAYIRLEVLSCVKKSGEVLERKISGYVAGEDGKVGLAGRVVSKQGQVLARMLLAGFIEGIGRIFQQSGTTVVVSPQGTLSTVNPSQALQAGISSGVATAARELVEFYKKLAEETYPVVEINAGRNVDLVFLQSVSFGEEERQERQQEARE